MGKHYHGEEFDEKHSITKCDRKNAFRGRGGERQI